MKEMIRKNGILFGIILAIIFGILIGGVFPKTAASFSILGHIFLNLLMMIVVPLVIFSMITGITNLGDIRTIGSIGRRTIVYYFATTALSVLVGIILVNIINPGKGVSTGEEHTSITYTITNETHSYINIQGTLNRKNYNKNYTITLLDQGLKASIQSYKHNRFKVSHWTWIEKKKNAYQLKTAADDLLYISKNNNSYKISKIKINKKGKGIKIDLKLVSTIAQKKDRDIVNTLSEVIVGNKKSNKEGLIPRNIINAMVRMEILPLIFFSLLFGAALSMLGEKGKKGIEFISICNDVIMKIVDWIMYIAPIGIFGIIAARIGSAGGFIGFLPELRAVGIYSLTVVLGLLFHGMVTLPLLLYFIGKRNPLLYIKGVASALLNAFSTASSSATLPLSMEQVQHNNNISSRTSSFVLPIGATINMDGTALYEAVAALFIAQVYGIHLGPIEQTIIFLTATLAAIGAAGIPEAGLVTMVIVLKAVGLPLEGIGLILTVDWLLDRCRTTVNVWGDCTGAGVIETLESEK